MKEKTGVGIAVKEVEKSFGSQHVLKKVNLDIAPGEFVAIAGKSGCGKSTFLRQVSGLEAPDGGRIYQDRELLRGLNSQARIMFQESRLVPWLSVLENVGVGMRLNKGWETQARWALEQVGLRDRASEWPSILSGGQKQRVALARALATRPRLMLLDEPLGALDALTRIEMQQLIETLWEEQKFTALFVTHDMSEAIQLADRVIVLEEGEVKLDLEVPLERPRVKSSRAFAQLEEKLLDQVLGKRTSEVKERSLAAAGNQ